MKKPYNKDPGHEVDKSGTMARIFSQYPVS